MDPLRIQDQPDPGDVRFVSERLNEYNFARVEHDHHQVLDIFLRDPDGKILAGLLGSTFWGWLHVDVLWVQDGLRGQGHGRALLDAAEREAVRRGCRLSHVETHTFQALPFYQKQGYTVFGELPDFPAGHCKYFLKKEL